MNQNIIRLSIDQISKFVNDTNTDLAIGRLMFLSTRPNTHKLNISDDVLRKYSPSIRGKWVVAEYSTFMNDVTNHTDGECIVGIVPQNAEVTFERAQDGYLEAYADCVISKLYATKVYELFKSHNYRSVSVEFLTDADPNVGGDVHVFDIKAITLLGLSVKPSVPKANMQIIQFSAKQAQQAEDFYNRYNLWRMSQNYTIDKSEKSLSNDDWSNIDKTELRNKILNASNKNSLVKSVYLKIENNWETAPSEKLKYPVMQLKGDKFVYNRGALANAKARATQQNETDVLNKINSIYKSLNIKENLDKMADEDKNKENVVMSDDPSKKGDPNATTPKDDPKPNEAPKDGEGKGEEGKMSEGQQTQSAETECKCSAEEIKAKDDKIAELTAKVAEFEAKVTEYEQKIATMSEESSKNIAELSELKKFKEDTENAQKMAVITSTLAETKDYLTEDNYKKFEAEGNACKFADINAWRNEVLANVTSDVLNKNKMSQNTQNNDHIEMPNIDADANKKHGLWD